MRGRGVPLRVGLVAATLVLVACGLLASGIAVTSILRHSLISRVDQTLLDASRGWAQAPRRLPPTPMRGAQPGPATVEFLRARHRSRRPHLDGDQRPRGRTRATRRQRRRTGTGDDRLDRRLPREVARDAVRGMRGELTTVAIDLSDVQSTVRALIWSQVGIGAAVLLVLGVAGSAVVHRSLRPLAEVEETAAAIAAGQLDRRVPQRDPRTEVGRFVVGAQRNARADPACDGIVGILR